jgi:5'-nucleotidase / UDP-sugar diphosphatase
MRELKNWMFKYHAQINRKGKTMLKNALSRVVLATLIFSAAAVAQTDTLTILHINDTHSCLAPLGPRAADLSGKIGGIARLATEVAAVRSTDRDVLFLHAGDYSIGDPVYNSTFGVPELTILKSLGLDAMTLGNHEFDLTPAVTEEALATAASTDGLFPILSANLVYPTDTSVAMKNMVVPYTIKEYGAMKVGIFGLTTPETNVLSQPAPIFVDTNFVETAAAMVDSLKNHGCSVVVLLSHLGEYFDQAVAANVPGIDVIVGGHDHYVVDEPIPVVNPASDTTWIVQSGAFYEYVGKLRLTVSAGKARFLDYRLVHLDNTIAEDPTVKATVDAVVAQVEEGLGQPFFSRKIGYATKNFEEISPVNPGSKLRDTPAGNLITDAFRDSMKTDVAITAGGSVAQPLYQGPIVGADVFRMLGYGFNTTNGLGYQMATYKLTGADILKALEFSVGTLDLNDEFQIQVSGMAYSYAPDQPAGSRLRSVAVGGIPIDTEKSYSVASNEFVLLMLNDFVSPQVGGIAVTDPQIYPGVTEYQVVCAYIAARDTISPRIEGRLIPVIERKNGTIPHTYSLSQNFPNPFNPATRIQFQIAKSGFVSLKVYNVLGQEVATLVNETRQAGEYTVQFDGSRLPSGVYFCRIEAGQFRSVKKMILIK